MPISACGGDENTPRPAIMSQPMPSANVSTDGGVRREGAASCELWVVAGDVAAESSATRATSDGWAAYRYVVVADATINHDGGHR